MKFHLSPPASGLLAITVLATLSVAHAQAPPAPSSAPADKLEEVIVNARREAESIQSVPVSIVAFNAENLREKSISTTEDIQISTPGVFLSGSGGRQNVIFQIRGQSKALSGPSSPAVVSYFAEVPDPTFGSSVPQYDISSIQVLKGPQGTLFGRNTTGGAVLYYPIAPTYQFGGYVLARGGNHSNQELQGAINVPLVADKVAVRVAGDYHQRDAYTKNIGVGGDPDNIDERAGRISLLLNPTEYLSNTTIFDYFKHRDDGFGSVLVDVNPPFSGPDGSPTVPRLLGLYTAAAQQLALQRARGPFVVDNSLPTYTRNERKSAINRTEVDFGAAQLVNIFGYRDTSLAYGVNVDGMPVITADGTGFVPIPAGTPVEFIKASLDNNTKQYSDEVQVRGKWFDDRLDWLGGLFYLKSKPSGAQGNWVAFSHIPGTPDFPAAFNFITETSKAAFTHLSYQLTEGLKLNAGFRYTKDEISSCTGTGLTSSSADAQPGDCNPGSTTLINVNDNTTKSSAPTWTVGLDWQINPNLFTYITSRRGYRTGGVNSPTYSGRLTQFQTFDPEKVTDVEVGVRSDWDIADVQVRANASAYRGWYKDAQAVLTGVQIIGACNPAIDNPPNVSPDGDCDPGNDPAGGTLLVNLGKSRVSGVDVELTVSPIRPLTLSLGGSWISPETRSLDASPTIAPYVTAEGIPFNLTARRTFTGAVRYDLAQTELGEFVFNADYYWSDRLQVTGRRLPSYSLINLRVDWNDIAGSPLDLGLFVRNLADKEYQSGPNASGQSLGLLTSLYGPPRMYGAELRYRFGGE
jgi:iron complex outermembrane receptor protein